MWINIYKIIIIIIPNRAESSSCVISFVLIPPSSPLLACKIMVCATLHSYPFEIVRLLACKIIWPLSLSCAWDCAASARLCSFIPPPPTQPWMVANAVPASKTPSTLLLILMLWDSVFSPQTISLAFCFIGYLLHCHLHIISPVISYCFIYNIIPTCTLLLFITKGEKWNWGLVW